MDIARNTNDPVLMVHYEPPTLYYAVAGDEAAVAVVNQMQALLQDPKYMKERQFLSGVECKVFSPNAVPPISRFSVAIFSGRYDGTFSPLLMEGCAERPSWARESIWGIMLGDNYVTKHAPNSAKMALGIFSNRGKASLPHGAVPWGPKKSNAGPRVWRPAPKRFKGGTFVGSPSS